MAYTDQTRGTASYPSYPYNPPQHQYNPPLQAPKAPVPGFVPFANGYHHSDSQQYQAHNTANSPHERQVLPSNQTQKQNLQRASVSAIPVALPSSYVDIGPITVSRNHSSLQETPAGTLASINHKFSSEQAPSQVRRDSTVDHQTLLLSLAEEYFAAAYGYASRLAFTQLESDVRDYYRLIATGLGCLEAVLSRFKLLPEREAVVRLWYATVLFEETENTMQAEEALGKGISLCDRHRFFDLKYNMQHLLARLLFDKSPRAALKLLDGIVQDVEAYQHIAWVYAFRFLKVSLYLRLSTHQDTLSALNQLRHIVTMSNGYGDKTVLATATVMEALTWLREPSDVENIEHAQRALAGVRALQYNPEIGELRQLAALTSIIDLCCSLQHFDPSQTSTKMQIMQSLLKEMHDSKTWLADGSFAIPMPNSRMPSCQSRSGVIRKQGDGSLVLVFQWIAKDDIYNLGYLLSGLALTHRNTQDGHKSEYMLEEGIRKLRCKLRSFHTSAQIDSVLDANDEQTKLAIPQSISLANAEQSWREQLICHMRLHLAFMLAARTSWAAAAKQQSQIRSSIELLSAESYSLSETLQRLPVYLEAIIHQGTGNLDLALRSYNSDTLSIQSYRKTNRPSRFHLDIALLSALNTLLIIRTPTHPSHSSLPALLSFLEHLCIRHQSKQIQSAYHFLTATAPSSSTILLTKSALQAALQTAKQSENNQLTCMVLNFICFKFFRGVVGDQSEKSAQASQRLAQKCMDTLWMSVAAGVLSDTLEAAGRFEEARVERQRGELVARNLPEKLQEAMRGDGNDGDVLMADVG